MIDDLLFNIVAFGGIAEFQDDGRPDLFVFFASFFYNILV
jgi:hypothetical protein